MSDTTLVAKPDWARDLPDQTPDGDPIVYGPRPLPPRLTTVSVEPPFHEGGAPILRAEFTTGEVRRLDLSDLVQRRPFEPLRDLAEAQRITVRAYGHGVEWACGADASAGYLYETGIPA